MIGSLGNEERPHGLKGRRLTEAHRRKLSKAKLGKKRSDRTRAKIKQTMLGMQRH
ncbi:NUMOD3 domain-containing DNA-binding protein [Bacillus sp. N9]